MLAARIALGLVISAVAFSQANDIGQRLRLALAGTGNEELAMTELASKNYAAVDQLLSTAPASGSQSRANLLSLRGAIAFLQGNMTAAAVNFADAAKLAPLTDGDTFTAAMALVSLDQKGEARSLLEHLARDHPERPIYVYWLGKLDYDEHRYEQAATELQQSLALDPKSARAWDSLGLTLDMQGLADQAHTAFEKAVVLNRQQTHSSPWPPHNLGYWLLRMNRLQDAEASLRESLRYDPTFAQAHYHLGRTLEKEGRDPEAATEYLTAVNSDTASADACYSLAVLYRKLKREPEAEAMFAEYKRRRQTPP